MFNAVPGNLSGESKTAYWNPADFNLLMFLGCLATETAPNVDWLVEMTPVDFVSKSIVKLTQVRVFLADYKSACYMSSNQWHLTLLAICYLVFVFLITCA